MHPRLIACALLPALVRHAGGAASAGVSTDVMKASHGWAATEVQVAEVLPMSGSSQVRACGEHASHNGGGWL
jgi:hypothetical protein